MESKTQEKKPTLLFVDDERPILDALVRFCRTRGWNTLKASSGSEGLALLDKTPVDVIVSDMRMPKMDGLQFLDEAKRLSPDTVRMMLTGNADQQTAIDAVNKGSIFRFYNKPCPPEELAKGIDAAIEQYQLVMAKNDLLERTLAGSVKVLVDVLTLVKPEAFQRTKIMRDWVQSVTKWMKLRNGWQISMSAMLSPIGEITMPPEVLKKLHSGEELTKEEHGMAKEIPKIGRDLLANIPRLKPVSQIIYYQKKNYDGSGFPVDEITGDKIPVGARILRILSDLTDLMTAADADPPYLDQFNQLESRKGHYDPEILAAVRASFISDEESFKGKVKREVVQIKVIDLEVGDVLTSNLEKDDGELVLAAGHEISAAQKESIRNLSKVCKLKEPLFILKRE